MFTFARHCWSACVAFVFSPLVWEARELLLHVWNFHPGSFRPSRSLMDALASTRCNLARLSMVGETVSKRYSDLRDHRAAMVDLICLSIAKWSGPITCPADPPRGAPPTKRQTRCLPSFLLSESCRVTVRDS